MSDPQVLPGRAEGTIRSNDPQIAALRNFVASTRKLEALLRFNMKGDPQPGMMYGVRVVRTSEERLVQLVCDESTPERYGVVKLVHGEWRRAMEDVERDMRHALEVCGEMTAIREIMNFRGNVLGENAKEFYLSDFFDRPDTRSCLQHIMVPASIKEVGPALDFLEAEIKRLEDSVGAAAKADSNGRPFYPAKWFDQFNIGGDMLRGAKRHKVIRFIKVGSRNHYSEPDARRLWPDRFATPGVTKRVQA